MEIQEGQEQQEVQDKEVIRVCQDSLEMQEVQALPDPEEIREQLAQQVPLDNKGPRVSVEKRVLQGNKEQLVPQVLVVVLEIQVALAVQVLEEILVQLEEQEQLETLVHLDQWETKEQMDHLD